MKKNLFIALEGIDGSGKSTQSQLLAERLVAAGHQVHLTCEPTRNRIGSIIRDMFTGKMEADHRTIAGLFVADRLHHILNSEDGILKKLREGYTVITDRYYFSSYAYQGAHLPMEWVIAANSFSAELLRPDMNVYIDISPEASMARINQGREQVELYETSENLRLVRERYFEAFELLRDEERVAIVDGAQQPEAVASDVWAALQGYGLL
jgi:dTMP kinase